MKKSKEKKECKFTPQEQYCIVCAPSQEEWEKSFDEFFQREYLGLLQEKLDEGTYGNMAKSSMIWSGIKSHISQLLKKERESLIKEITEHFATQHNTSCFKHLNSLEEQNG